MTVLDSSPAPTACPENGDGGFGIPTANGRRVLIVSTPSALLAEMPLAVMLSLVSVRCSRISARIAGRLEPDAPISPSRRTPLITFPAMPEHAHSASAAHQERGRQNDPAVQDRATQAPLALPRHDGSPGSRQRSRRMILPELQIFRL